MTYLSLIPRRRARSVAPGWGLDVDRFVDDFVRGFDLQPAIAETAAAFQPRLDVSEDEKEVRVEAELPGLDEKDVELSLSENTLTIKGEKKSVKEEEGKNYHRQERVYGAFQREIGCPFDIDASKVEATFKNGILTVVLPKSEAAKEETKKIPIKSS